MATATSAPPNPTAVPQPVAGPLVPLRAAWAVGAVLLALLAAIGSNSRWALDFFHVAGGGIWTAIDLFMGFVIGPILARLEIPARMALSRRLMPVMLLLMPTLVLVTLASGSCPRAHPSTAGWSPPSRWWA